jgi:hypothetical protein
MSEMPEDGQQAAAPRLEFGLVKVARADAAEKWLVDMLLSLESDLSTPEFAAQPMIFAVFGRGRALPPFVGKGITRDNLLECVYFLTGACSCTVKDQNPGMDLLFATDWWSVAEKLATAVGAEEGNEAQLGAAQLFPTLMIPGGEEVAEAPKEAAGAPKETTSAKPAVEPAKPASAPATEDKPQAAAENKAAPKTDDKPADKPEKSEEPEMAKEPPPEQPQQPAKEQPAEKPDDDVKSAPQPSPAEPEQTPAAPPAGEPAGAAAVHAETEPATHAADAISVFAVGAGLCVALAVLFGVTFLILRPK